MVIQELASAEPHIRTAFRKHPNSSLAKLFKDIRGMAQVSFFGDWQIMSMILQEAAKVGTRLTRKKVYNMLLKSEDYSQLEKAQKISFYSSLIFNATGKFKLPSLRTTSNAHLTQDGRFGVQPTSVSV